MEQSSAPRIHSLNHEVTARIHSSKHISSLRGVILALLENSLDAGSSNVEILVDWPRGGCVIEDNGSGIPAIEFRHDGGLARMYCTSKRQPDGDRTNPDFETHGTTGTFLAELASLSMLIITSKTSNLNALASITLHLGNIIDRHTARSRVEDAPFDSSVQRHGTVVTVRDLFGSMPVRVKQRSLASGEYFKSWHELKQGVLALLLAWPGPCTVRLRDVNSDSRVVTLASRLPQLSTELTRKSLNQLSGKDEAFDLRDVLPLLFQSGLVSSNSRSLWVPLSASTSSIILKGMICLQPAPTKNCQFLSIGVWPCDRNTDDLYLYDFINKIFRSSDFGHAEHVEMILPGVDPSDKQLAAKNQGVKQTETGKAIDRFAMFYINLTFRRANMHAWENLQTLSESTIAAINQVLQTAITSWLEKHLFRPKKPRKSRNSDQQGPSASIRPSSPTTLPLGALRSELPADVRMMKSDFDAAALRNSSSLLPLNYHDGDLDSRSHIRTSRTSSRADTGYGDKRPPIHASVSGALLEEEKGETRKCPRNILKPLVIENGEFSRVIEEGQTEQQNCEGVENSSAPPNQQGRNAATETWTSNFPHAHALSDDFGSIDEDDLIGAAESVEHNFGTAHQPKYHNRLVPWRDPTNNLAYGVNNRTGIVTPLERQLCSHQGFKPDSTLLDEGFSNIKTHSSSSVPIRLIDRRLCQGREDMGDDQKAARWLPGFLKAWKNPIFNAQSEDPIPTSNLHGFSITPLSSRSGCSSHAQHNPELLSASIRESTTQLSKAGLAVATVISQVDRKFVLCKWPLSASNALSNGLVHHKTDNRQTNLVLIDQHAASERIIVEMLLRDFCRQLQRNDTTAESRQYPLDNLGEKPECAMNIQLDVTENERKLFTTYRSHFAAWGVRYDILASNKGARKDDAIASGQTSRVVVTALPSVIAERCSNFPKLCIDMIRTELWELADAKKRPVVMATMQSRDGNLDDSSSGNGDAAWVQFISSCPQGILDMIISRACRSAIMFNDVLTCEQCEELVRGLRTCAFPFVCAHGRVSMVPALQLEDPTSLDFGSHQNEAESKDLGSAMHRWLRSEAGLKDGKC